MCPPTHSIAAIPSFESTDMTTGMAPTSLRPNDAAGPSRLELTLHEGRKHQVKRMCAAVGHPVTRLHRRAYAGLTVAGLAPGEWRELTPAELEALRAPRAPQAVRHRGRDDVLDDDEPRQAIP